jgi:RNA polymerase sigma factor (sigma-70 family)
MVLGVCRRILGNVPDVADAFQATFVIFLRKAAAIRPRAQVGNWLHGVARHTAWKTRALAQRRRHKERRLDDLPEPAAREDVTPAALSPGLDEELTHLPNKYRAAIVLCDLEGKTRMEAAAELGWPEGTVAGRLARARDLLARRLARRGLAVTATSLAAWMAAQARAQVLPAWQTATLRAGGRSPLGRADVLKELLPARVLTLAEGVLQTMFWKTLWQRTARLCLLLTLPLLVLGLLALSAGADDPTAETSAPPVQDNGPPAPADAIAWGEVKDGLQVGLSIPRAPVGGYRLGDRVTFQVFLRNASQRDITLHMFDVPKNVVFEMLSLPVIESSTGTKLETHGITYADVGGAREMTLAPGVKLKIGEPRFFLNPPNRSLAELAIQARPGKYQVYYPKVYLFEGKTLATGKVTLEIKDNPPAAAWGQEVDGIQYGLAYESGVNTVHHAGGLVRFYLKARNVAAQQKTVTLWLPDGQGDKLGWLISPVVQDTKGTNLTVQGILPPVPPLNLKKKEFVLPPGKEADLAIFGYSLRPLDSKERQMGLEIFTQPGTYSIQFRWPKQLPGAPALTPWSTGKLQLDIRPAPDLAVAWGEPVEGIQYGVGCADRPSYQFGEYLTLVIQARNLTRSPKKVYYLKLNDVPFMNRPHDLSEFCLPRLTAMLDGKIKVIGAVRPLRPQVATLSHELQPGEVFTLYRAIFRLRPLDWESRPPDWKDSVRYTIVANPGLYEVQYTCPSGVKNAPAWSTGRLPLLFTAEEQMDPALLARDKTTAWGKVSDGIQYGLAFQPPEKTEYRLGDVVTVVLKARNVTRRKVPLWFTGKGSEAGRYDFAVFSRLTIKDTSGERKPLHVVPSKAKDRPGSTSAGEYQPGAVWEIGASKLLLKPLGGPRGQIPVLEVTPGTYTIECARVNFWDEGWRPADATGRLALKVLPAK